MEEGEEKKEHSHKALFALLIGAAIGAGAVLLLTSKKGRDARKKLLKFAEEMLDKIRN